MPFSLHFFTSATAHFTLRLTRLARSYASSRTAAVRLTSPSFATFFQKPSTTRAHESPMHTATSLRIFACTRQLKVLSSSFAHSASTFYASHTPLAPTRPTSSWSSSAMMRMKDDSDASPAITTSAVSSFT